MIAVKQTSLVSIPSLQSLFVRWKRKKEREDRRDKANFHVQIHPVVVSIVERGMSRMERLEEHG